MGKIDMGGRDGGDAPQEHPQGQGIAWERCEEEEGVGGGEEEEGGSSGAEDGSRGGGSVIWWTSALCKLHWICKNTNVTRERERKPNNCYTPPPTPTTHRDHSFMVCSDR